MAVTVVDCGRRCRSPQLVFLPLLAFAKALRDRRSPVDQRSLIREALREIGVILLHDVERGFLGQLSMVLGKESVQVSELFVVHGYRASAAVPKLYRNLLILRQLLTRLVTVWENKIADCCADIGDPGSPVNHLLTMTA